MFHLKINFVIASAYGHSDSFSIRNVKYVASTFEVPFLIDLQASNTG